MSILLTAAIIAPASLVAESPPEPLPQPGPVSKPVNAKPRVDGVEFALQGVLGIGTTFVGGVGGLLLGVAASGGFDIFGSNGCDGWAPGTCNAEDWPESVGWGIGAATATGLLVPIIGKQGFKNGKWVRAFVGSYAGAALAFIVGLIPADRNDGGGPVYIFGSLLTVPLGATLCYHFCPFLGEQSSVGLAPTADGDAVFSFSTRF